jgi:ATP-dependent exoDNAse (exonuclease V) beta subunit
MSTGAIILEAADAKERTLCLDVSESIVVQAPAGSGKTGLLVLRFLALLARVERPEAVLAITFTRKAAGEMRRRIVDALVDARTRTVAPERAFERERYEYARAVLARDEEKQWGLLHSPSRLQVFTIDSFCSRIVAGTPLLSRLGSTPEVVDDATPLYREAVRRAMSPEGRALLGERLEILLERYEMGLDRLESQLMAMLARRDQWREGAVRSRHDESAWVIDIEASFAAAIAAEVESIAADVDPGLIARIHDIAIQSRDVVGAGTAWPTLGDADRLGSRVECAYAWKQAAAMLTKDGKKLRAQRTRDEDVYGSDAALKTDFRRLMDEIESSPLGPARWLELLRAAGKLPASPRFTDDGRSALGAFLSVLRQADAALWEVFRERRQVDYVEISMSAVAALSPGETLERLDARLEHILIDEFQDTNVLQCDLLRGLTCGWQHGDGRTLFLVGDPMQSIYRFRKAEVGLFLAARSSPRFLETCRLYSRTLSVNFRSTRSVVGWVNRTFGALLGDRDDATRSLVAFASADPRPEAEDGIEVDFVLWTSATSVQGAEADAVEAAGLADWIAEHLRRRCENGTPSGSHEPSIAVLVRSRAHALPLLRALESRAPEVRVRAPGLDHLGDRTTAIDLQALTRALLHPGDRLSWLALLRSPWIGLGLGDLARLVEPDVAERRARAIPLVLRDADVLSRVSADARDRIARLLAVTDAARRDLAVRPIDVAVRAAWLRLGGPTSPASAIRLDALDAEAFFDLLAARSRGGSVDLDELSRALGEAEAPVDLDAEVDLEIMTMHKAKGLEFDTVILPSLASRAGGNDQLPLAMETEPDTGRLTLVTPRGARGRDDADSDKYDFVGFREARRREAETLRLLYVAATRTRHCLLLSAAEGRLNKDDSAPAGSLLASFAPAIRVSDARRVAAPVAMPAVRRAMTRLTHPFRLPAVPASVADRSIVSEAPSQLAEQTPEFFAEGKLPAHIGSVYHAFVERIAADGVDAWPPARIEKDRAAIAHALRAEGVLASELDGATRRVAAALSATVADERGRWMLSASGDAREARSEWAMTAWQDGRMISAKLDRSFVADGVRWIVDFKTGMLGSASGADGEAELERRVAERSAQYAIQLASYRRLVEGRQGQGEQLPIRLALFFAEWPAGRRWHDITALADAAGV